MSDKSIPTIYVGKRSESGPIIWSTEPVDQIPNFSVTAANGWQGIDRVINAIPPSADPLKTEQLLRGHLGLSSAIVVAPSMYSIDDVVVHLLKDCNLQPVDAVIIRLIGGASHDNSAPLVQEVAEAYKGDHQPLVLLCGMNVRILKINAGKVAEALAQGQTRPPTILLFELEQVWVPRLITS
jgi:hypothetical protein